MKKSMMTKLAAVGLVATWGCSVDLSREEAILRILIDGASTEAEEISVEVSDGGDLPPYQDVFALTGAPSQPLPDISVARGTVWVTAVTIDGNGRTIDGPYRESRMLNQGTNGMTIDFSTDPPRTVGATEGLVTAVSRQSFSVEPADGRWAVAVDSATWSNAIAELTTALGGAPTTLTVRHITVATDSAGDDDTETFDEIWSGDVVVTIEGGQLMAPGGRFVAQDFNSFQTKALDIDIMAWLTPPGDARVVLSGASASDDLELPIQLSVTIELLGGR